MASPPPSAADSSLPPYAAHSSPPLTLVHHSRKIDAAIGGSPKSWILCCVVILIYRVISCLVCPWRLVGGRWLLWLLPEAVPSRLPLLLLKWRRLLRDPGRAPDSSSCPKEASELSPRSASCSCGLSCPVCLAL